MTDRDDGGVPATTDRNPKPNPAAHFSGSARVVALLVLGVAMLGAAPGAAPAATSAKKPAVTTATATRSTPAKSTKSAKSTPAKKVTPGKVATGWSVQNPLKGWERFRDVDWPATGEALGAVSRKASLDVRRGPSVGEPGLRFAKGRSSTGPVTFLVIQDHGDWLEVAIPVRPNGTVGWVRSSDVQRLNLSFRVVVDLSRNLMIIERDGSEVYRHAIASGTGNTPTPTGLFFVRELVREADDGPYGPYVLGLSGYSDVLYSFKGGEGAIAIHGTNAPDSIGSNASFGCVRITNESMRELVKLLPLGTPVEIVRDMADLPTVRRSRARPDPGPTQDLVVEEIAQESGGVDIANAPTYNVDAIDFIEPTAATPDRSPATQPANDTANVADQRTGEGIAAGARCSSVSGLCQATT